MYLLRVVIPTYTVLDKVHEANVSNAFKGLPVTPMDTPKDVLDWQKHVKEPSPVSPVQSVREQATELPPSTQSVHNVDSDLDSPTRSTDQGSVNSLRSWFNNSCQ